MSLSQSDRNKLLLIFSIGVIAFILFREIPLSFKSGDTGNYIAIAALLIGAWQIQDARESKIEGAIADLRKELENAISKVEKHGNGRDTYLEQHLYQIQQQIAPLGQQFLSHQEDVKRFYDHLFKSQRELSEYGAAIAVLGKQGEIILAVSDIRTEIAKLQKEVKAVQNFGDRT